MRRPAGQPDERLLRAMLRRVCRLGDFQSRCHPDCPSDDDHEASGAIIVPLSSLLGVGCGFTTLVRDRTCRPHALPEDVPTSHLALQLLLLGGEVPIRPYATVAVPVGIGERADTRRHI